ncbi:hypothetical protein [Streptomyces sp. RP5T]|uniref:hypothetical protein n=1 Tax=Streptomyces sp. RP5T TaxID=2490848 RepID=UPI000F6502B1|nr:hypothetical protein [Streptomyces sp. RP5T]
MSLVSTIYDTPSTDIADDSRKMLAGHVGPLSPGDPQHVRSGPGGRPQNCRTDDRDSTPPTAAPPDVRWQKLVALMVPTSPSAGPLHTDSAMWWCFARTPTGAALAAHIIPVQLSGPAWRTVAAQQMVPGEPRDRFVTSKARAKGTSSSQNAMGRFAGFSVDSYSHDSATVRLLVTNPMGGYRSTSVSVRWRDGDWKVAAADNGALYTSAQRANPSGFVIWGA